ncbi:hypothetical protein DQ04_00621120 [Trypanosoma grayi]|uniref:hypothetical protein n=1 Tax=Trypanosoma grayi TaxID=71804 RepID=UPI0004F49576|nr:hypothetical protein DQ04_00621120 [Trypanosoma grayi]KEG14103.1 hypothetical protein DQ04_00621120 [Trypanosoma grayi]
MNQLEYFVASSESARSDAWRYVRRLRELDFRIDEELDRLREIAQAMEKFTAGKKREQVSRENGYQRKNGKRGRSSSQERGASATLIDDSASDDASVVSMEPHHAQMLMDYRKCRRRAYRCALEREKVAAELKACGDEMTEYLAIRMAHLKQTLRNTGSSLF